MPSSEQAAKPASRGESVLNCRDEKLVRHGPMLIVDKNTLELAQAGAAKIETVANELRASWASPLSGEVRKELVCDKAVVTVMKERVPEETFLKFEKVIEGRCPAVSKQPSQPVEERVF